MAAAATSAFAAAEPSSTSLDASFCLQVGSQQRCYEIDGTLRYLDTTVGSSYTINKIVRTTVYDSGEYVGETMSTQYSRGVFEEDGTVVISTVTNTRSTVGDEPCTYRLVLRLVDYETVVYESTQTCV